MFVNPTGIFFQLDQSVKDLLSEGQDIDDPTSDEDIADTSEALGKIINVDEQDSFRVYNCTNLEKMTFHAF